MTLLASNSLQLAELIKNELKNTIFENIYQYSFVFMSDLLLLKDTLKALKTSKKVYEVMFFYI